jgi:hypothetical protein
MAYKLKPNYHFINTDSVGIDKVPVGRLIVVEDYGNQHEIKWLRKVSNIGLDETTTINEALTLNGIDSPFDTKRDFTDSYSITEVDSILTNKRDISDCYDKIEVDLALSLKRDIEDSYIKNEIDAMLSSVQFNTVGIYEHANLISNNYTIKTGNNAMSVGPITIGEVTISIPNGAVWIII